MTRTAKQSVGLFLIVAVLGVLAWRLWPDGGRGSGSAIMTWCARWRRTTSMPAIRLLNEGADPNAQMQPTSFTRKVQIDYNNLSRGLQAPSWSLMDAVNLRAPVLEVAVEHDKVSMVKALLAKGADVERRDRMGDTALSRGQMLSGRSLQESGAHDQNLIFILLKAAEAKKTARP